MASTIIDSRIFGDMFSDARMREVWSDENRTAKYLDIERALAKVQGELGIIPKEAADEIVRNCNLSQIDWARLKAKTEQIGYPIIAVVNQINANCRDKLGEYCHWGATTQDITDTAAVLQMREGLALVEQDLDEIADQSPQPRKVGADAIDQDAGDGFGLASRVLVDQHDGLERVAPHEAERRQVDQIPHKACPQGVARREVQAERPHEELPAEDGHRDRS